MLSGLRAKFWRRQLEQREARREPAVEERSSGGEEAIETADEEADEDQSVRVSNLAIATRMARVPINAPRTHQNRGSRRSHRRPERPRYQARGARDRGEGTSPQARARVLGRLRVRRLAVAPTRARGKADEQQRKRLGEADEPGLPLRSTPIGGSRAAIV